MSEVNVERLKRLKKIAENVRGNGAQTTTMNLTDIDFFNEQAERAQELESALVDIQNQLFSIRGKNNMHDAEITGLCAEIREVLEGL